MLASISLAVLAVLVFVFVHSAGRGERGGVAGAEVRVGEAPTHSVSTALDVPESRTALDARVAVKSGSPPRPSPSTDRVATIPLSGAIEGRVLVDASVSMSELSVTDETHYVGWRDVQGRAPRIGGHPSANSKSESYDDLPLEDDSIPVARDGSFRLEHVESGIRTVHVLFAGVIATSIEGVHVESDQTNRDARLNPLDLRGRVRKFELLCRDGTGAPLAGEAIHCSSNLRSLDIAADDDGRLLFLIEPDESDWCFEQQSSVTTCVSWKPEPQVVVLGPRVRIEVAVGPGVAPADHRLRIGLERLTPGGNNDPWKAFFDDVDASGRAALSLRSYGRYRWVCELDDGHGHRVRDDAGATELDVGPATDGARMNYPLSQSSIAELVRRAAKN